MKKSKSYLLRYSAKRLLPFYLLTLLPLLTSCGDFYEFDQQSAVEAGEMVLGRDEIYLLKGDEFTIPVSITPEEISNQEVFWYSENEDVITVENGQVKAIGVGTSIITAISVSEQLKATCTVHVLPIWHIIPENYPRDMVVYAQVTIHGEPADESTIVAAFCEDELRGIGEIKEVNGIRYMVIRVYSPYIYGDDTQPSDNPSPSGDPNERDEDVEETEEGITEIITFKCLDRKRAELVEFSNKLIFDGEAHGTLSNLYQMTIN